MPVDIVYQQPPRNPNHWVDQIYQCAKKKDAEGLKNLLAQGVFIDERYQSSPFTAAAMLASELDKDSVKFLLQFGANINLTAFGVAYAKNYDYSEHFRIHYGAEPLYLARGAAAAGDEGYAEWLRMVYHLRPHSIAHWAAWGGHLIYAETLRTDERADINLIAAGAAKGGYRDYADLLVPVGDPTTLHFVAGGAAEGGHFEHSEFLRMHRNANLNIIASAAAAGGHRNYSENLRTQHHADKATIAKGAAISGHRQHSENLRTRDLLKQKTNIVAVSAVMGANFAYVEELYVKHGADLKKIAHAISITSHFKNPQLALRTFAFIKDDKFRNKLASELLKYSIVNTNVCNPIVKIAKQAGHVRALQKKYNFTYDQARAWIDRRELRDFALYFYALTKMSDTRPVYLPVDVFLLIMSFSFPTFSAQDIATFFNVRKVLGDNNKNKLQKNLSTYSHGLFNKNRKDAKKLLKDVKAAASNTDVNRMLTNTLFQLQDKKPDPEFQKILKRHRRN